MMTPQEPAEKESWQMSPGQAKMLSAIPVGLDIENLKTLANKLADKYMDRAAKQIIKLTAAQRASYAKAEVVMSGAGAIGSNDDQRKKNLAAAIDANPDYKSAVEAENAATADIMSLDAEIDGLKARCGALTASIQGKSAVLSFLGSTTM